MTNTLNPFTNLCCGLNITKQLIRRKKTHSQMFLANEGYKFHSLHQAQQQNGRPAV